MLGLVYDGRQYLFMLNENVTIVCYELEFGFW